MSKAPNRSGSPTTTQTACPSAGWPLAAVRVEPRRQVRRAPFTLFLMDISSLDLGKPRGEGGGRQNSSRVSCEPPPRREPALPALAFVVAGRDIRRHVLPQSGGTVMDHPGHELPVHRIPNIGPAVEFSFFPDGKRIIGIARGARATSFTASTRSTSTAPTSAASTTAARTRCSYFFPTASASSGRRPAITRNCQSAPILTPPTIRRVPSSTRRISTAATSAVTHNIVYDAEVSVSPDGQWVLFGRQTDGKMDLWKIRPDGTEEVQITGSKAGSRAAASTSPTTAPSSSAPGERSTSAARRPADVNLHHP